ncbi:pantothenate synthetase [Loktanella fryxellensis]|uniref:Pantothenate synthetase n=1 Tax=Loktanella fryxellensis TaxID=245187 RepID=A0A1H8D6Q9_9RHOB|nr:pantoate--beta-alanine ligase [Loktanella fryxellensis]SEN02876.1 pantothenate synthetase [Loktanella fryxellensis]
MQVCRTVDEIRSAVATLRANGSVGLVTTMGALHAGHMALVAAAQADHAAVVVTIFVNPTQFGDPADLAAYPRRDDADLALLAAAGVDAVFLPDAAAIYPPGDQTIVDAVTLAQAYHGAVRPGHFRGVATVVTKLFNIAGADAAYFGEKDYQQLAVIRQLVRDLFVPISIHGVPTVRDGDGLALSSRNLRLTPGDRAAAPILHRALRAAADTVRHGGTVEDAAQTIAEIVATEPRATLRGIDIVNAADFSPATGAPTAPIGIMLSAQFGDVLLIDQKEILP